MVPSKQMVLLERFPDILEDVLVAALDEKVLLHNYNILSRKFVWSAAYLQFFETLS